MKLVFATNNPYKLKEIQQALPESIQLLSLSDIHCFEEIEETETTLQGNSQLKANFITENYGYDCFADDTGLEVETLNGAPGVYSARYAGERATFEDNIHKLLEELKDERNRSASFRTVITLNLNQQQYFFEGICKGEILEKRAGVGGFGYDAIFKPEGFDQSFTEMTLEQKNKISHRGLAVQKLIEFLKGASK